MIMRIVSSFICGVLIGVGATLLFVNLNNNPTHKFINHEINEYGYASLSTFMHSDPKVSLSIQTQYAGFIYRAWKSGIIDDLTYQRMITLANIRTCINYEDIGKDDLSKRMYAIVKSDIQKWGRDWDIKKIKAVNLQIRKNQSGFDELNKLLSLSNNGKND